MDWDSTTAVGSATMTTGRKPSSSATLLCRLIEGSVSNSAAELEDISLAPLVINHV